MPTAISTMAPVPRCEPLVVEGFEVDGEGVVADASITGSISDTDREGEVVDGYTADGGVLYIVMTAGEAIDLSTDVEMGVVESGDVEGAGT